MDKYEIRRVRLAELRDTRCNGKAAELARRIVRSPTYVLRMLYPSDNPNRKRIADDMIEVIERAFDLPHGWLDGKNESREIKIDYYIDENLKFRAIPQEFQDTFRAPYDCPTTAHAVQSRSRRKTDGWVIVLDGIKTDPAESLGQYTMYCLQDGTLGIGALSKGYIKKTFNVNRLMLIENHDLADVMENVSVIWTENILWVRP